MKIIKDRLQFLENFKGEFLNFEKYGDQLVKFEIIIIFNLALTFYAV